MVSLFLHGKGTAILPTPAQKSALNLQMSKDNLGGDYPMLAGNLTSICTSAIICAAISLWKPQNYDWKSTQEIPVVEEDGTHKLAASGKESCCLNPLPSKGLSRSNDCQLGRSAAF